MVKYNTSHISFLKNESSEDIEPLEKQRIGELKLPWMFWYFLKLHKQFIPPSKPAESERLTLES